MEEAFNNLQKDGKNDVDNLMKWIKEAKLIDGSKEQEEKARNLFKDVPDVKNVALEKFKEIVKKLAEDLKKNLSEITKQLAETGPSLLLSALGGTSIGGAAVGALKNVMGIK